MAENKPRPMSDTNHPKPRSTGSTNPNPPPKSLPPKVNTAPAPNQNKRK